MTITATLCDFERTPDNAVIHPCCDYIRRHRQYGVSGVLANLKPTEYSGGRRVIKRNQTPSTAHCMAYSGKCHSRG